MTGTTTKVNDTVLQKITSLKTRAAIFLVLTINSTPSDGTVVLALGADLSGLVRSLGFRDPDAGLTCVMGFSAGAWERLFGDAPRPLELHPFREFHADTRHAIATPGDLLFHIRADRDDLCFDLAALIMERLGAAVAVADEIRGFQYYDNRNLLGFVDGSENPQDQEAVEAVLIGAEDPAFAGGSYVVVQKYIHDLTGWNALPVETQERIIGRKKLENIELDATVKPTHAHNALTVITENGQERKILRENRPFGRPGEGEFGTYFIGYCRSARIIERMLENMFIGFPPGNYDRLLDYSRAVTGGLFFVPTRTFLGNLGAGDPAPEASPSNGSVAPGAPVRDGSLGIGSLKGSPS
ncbi:MAG TPA: Dyp-type peroxidase [Methylocella sp.]|nr:Dyp-type peroxidase [Methylocella sp.]